MACWWLEDYATGIDARERAYRLFRQAGGLPAPPPESPSGSPTTTPTSGARPPSPTAGSSGPSDCSTAWLPSPEHALLAYQKAHVALMGQRDPVAARRLSQEAAAIARSVGPADMEMLGVALEGLAMVTEGDVAEGMSRLDEATAAATAGELSDPGMIGTACCYLIRACEQVHDYDRAAQWCERVREFCRRWKFTHLFSACRIQYASLLTLRGEWAEAEREIEALRRHVERVQPRVVPIALIRLGDLRRRQGRWEEADGSSPRAASHYLAVLGRAALALDRGESGHGGRRWPRNISGGCRPMTGPSGYPDWTCWPGHASRNASWTRPVAPSTSSGAIAEAVGTEPLQATVAHAEGCLLAAQGDHKGACARLEESADLFERNRTPFEAARSRLQLAHTLLALGRRDPAAIALRAAGTAFEQLGAARHAAAARLLLQELDLKPHGPIGAAAKLGRLTAARDRGAAAGGPGTERQGIRGPAQAERAHHPSPRWEHLDQDRSAFPRGGRGPGGQERIAVGAPSEHDLAVAESSRLPDPIFRSRTHSPAAIPSSASSAREAWRRFTSPATSATTASSPSR